ncbi:MAG: cold-shock protein, partial [Rhizobiaceae bacterium]
MGDKASSGRQESERSDFAAREGAAEDEVLAEVSGAIKWFDVAKGYGFILPDATSPQAGMGDVLLHV